MAARSARPSSWLRLAVAAAAASFAGTNAFSTTPPSGVKLLLHPVYPSGRRFPSYVLLAKDDDNGDVVKDGPAPPASAVGVRYHTPMDRPFLAAADALGLVLFAAIETSYRHGGGEGWGVGGGDDGGSGPLVVLATAFPLVAAWMMTSPITGVYSPDDRSDDDILSSTASKVARGCIVALPLGIVLGELAGGHYYPSPVPLLIALAILVGLRILYCVAEDFFVEWRSFS
ncbi:hypothetical protein ACHAW5_006413 [Stephanodiscus triporus]|uniref:Uncharacterized protein n=1 Tax=Stephanodiscus triporus TaxID=2934178 RepID=A0ABD3NQQ7_9STRA